MITMIEITTSSNSSAQHVYTLALDLAMTLCSHYNQADEYLSKRMTAHLVGSEGAGTAGAFSTSLQAGETGEKERYCDSPEMNALNVFPPYKVFELRFPKPKLFEWGLWA
ncbi:hypothetical protein ILYODFUR_037536 [Ilyodon furcidens]|uniref:Uncharacterized protein n=1 Tax=Ilyodon furcidens TaxID=33524 RepID=A0ABV0TEC6_9TELE